MQLSMINAQDCGGSTEKRTQVDQPSKFASYSCARLSRGFVLPAGYERPVFRGDSWGSIVRMGDWLLPVGGENGVDLIEKCIFLRFAQIAVGQGAESRGRRTRAGTRSGTAHRRSWITPPEQPAKAGTPARAFGFTFLPRQCILTRAWPPEGPFGLLAAAGRGTEAMAPPCGPKQGPRRGHQHGTAPRIQKNRTRGASR